MALLKGERTAEFSPMRIGLSKPQNAKTYEFLVIGKNDKTLNLELHKIFSKHKGSLLLQYGYVDDSSNQLVLDSCYDLTKADCSPDELLLELRRVSHVVRVDKKLMKNSLYQNFLSPLTIIDRFRSIVIGVDPLIKIERHLNDLIGVQGTTLMYDEGRSYAIDLVKQHREAIIPHISANSEIVLQNIQAGLKASGWGTYDIRLEGEMANVIITDLPAGINSELADTSSCTFVYGVVAGIVEGLYGFEMNVRNVSYDKSGNILKLVYTPKETQEEISGVIENQESSMLSLQVEKGTETIDSPDPPIDVSAGSIEGLDSISKEIENQKENNDEKDVTIDEQAMVSTTTTLELSDPLTEQTSKTVDKISEIPTTNTISFKFSRSTNSVEEKKTESVETKPPKEEKTEPREIEPPEEKKNEPKESKSLGDKKTEPKVERPAEDKSRSKGKEKPERAEEKKSSRGKLRDRPTSREGQSSQDQKRHGEDNEEEPSPKSEVEEINDDSSSDTFMDELENQEDTFDF